MLVSMLLLVLLAHPCSSSLREVLSVEHAENGEVISEYSVTIENACLGDDGGIWTLDIMH
jgi:hypothetical protein